jgi:hypothetical protein
MSSTGNALTVLLGSSHEYYAMALVVVAGNPKCACRICATNITNALRL